MSSITFLVSAVLTVFMLNAFDEANITSAVGQLDRNVQELASSTADELVNIEYNQSLNLDNFDSDQLGQSAANSQTEITETVSSI